MDALTAMPHVFGARLTGGGFGGAVMALTDADFSQEHARSVVGKYAAQFSSRPDILACEPGDGAETIVLPP